MLVYWLYLFIIILQSVIINKYFKCEKISLNIANITISKNQLILALACFELIILTGLRSYNIGADTLVYLDALDYYKSLDHNNILFAELVEPFDFEIGYFFLTKICAWLGCNKTVFLFIIATLIYLPLFKTIETRSTKPILSILIYFGLGIFSYSLGIFRQMIACSILLIGIKYIEKREIFKYIFIVLLASSFHLTALIALPIYWLYTIKISKTVINIFLFIEIIFLFFGRYILLFIFNLLPSYSGYINSQYDLIGGSYLMLVFFAIIAILSLRALDDKNKVSFISLYITIMIQTLAYSMNLFGRLVPYFSIHLIILIPQLIDFYFTKKETKKMAIIFVSIIFMLLTFKDLYGNKYVCPYNFVWNQQIEEK